MILLINDGVKTFSVLRFGQILQLNVCQGARCNNLNEQNLSSLEINALYPGADPGFFSGGGALVSCSTSTPINHIVFFFAEYQLYFLFTYVLLPTL